MEYAFIFGALILGGVVGFFLATFKAKSESSRLEERNSQISEKLNETESKLEKTAKDFELKLDLHHKEKEEALREERDKSAKLDRELAGMKAEYEALHQKLAEQKGELEHMQEQLKVQFENLANKILEENSQKFSNQHKESLNQLLNPLGTKLDEFKKKVEDTYDEENRQRATLKEQIRQMSDLNEKMREDAKNLTKALKGDSKTQGNWGEVILQRILEKSGLRKDEEYYVEQSVTTEEGRRFRPDVIVRLPDEKYLIIDSKVTLTAYERYSSADTEEEARAALKAHILSLRTHVKGLSEKRYQHIHGDRSPDFVLLFVPIESAFGTALQTDFTLYNEAFDRNIVIVSPSTLLATLATINSVWKQEYQSKNAQEIADRGAALYDKFVLFIESMEQLGDRIKQTQKSYDQAKNRLSDGAGNLVRQVEMLKELGVKNSKELPEGYSSKER